VAEVRAPLDERTLRDTREELIDAHTEMQGQFGVPVPSRREAENLIDPILRKVEREHSEERYRDYLRPVPKPETNRTRHDGEWYGEPDHSPKVPASVAGEKVTLTQHEVGEVILDKRTGTVKTPDGKPLALPETRADRFRRTTLGALLAHVVAESSREREWYDRWQAIGWRSGLPAIQRADQAIQLMDRWLTLHPDRDPRRVREKRIIVGA
jgi:hypothetical protein